MKVLTLLNKCQWKRKENLWCCCSFIGLKLLYYFSALDDDEYQCESNTRSDRFVFCSNGSNVLCFGFTFVWTSSVTGLGIISVLCQRHLAGFEAFPRTCALGKPVILRCCLYVPTFGWTGLAGTDLAQSIVSEWAQIVFVSLRSPQLHAYDGPSCALQLFAHSKSFLSWKAVTCGGLLSKPLASVSDCILMLWSCHLVT